MHTSSRSAGSTSETVDLALRPNPQGETVAAARAIESVSEPKSSTLELNASTVELRILQELATIHQTMVRLDARLTASEQRLLEIEAKLPG